MSMHFLEKSSISIGWNLQQNQALEGRQRDQAQNCSTGKRADNVWGSSVFYLVQMIIWFHQKVSRASGYHILAGICHSSGQFLEEIQNKFTVLDTTQSNCSHISSAACDPVIRWPLHHRQKTCWLPRFSFKWLPAMATKHPWKTASRAPTASFHQFCVSWTTDLHSTFSSVLFSVVIVQLFLLLPVSGAFFFAIWERFSILFNFSTRDQMHFHLIQLSTSAD